ncbi:MAG: hypothetical protein R3Y64_10520 [Peptostreptococcaceae bacterium]
MKKEFIIKNVLIVDLEAQKAKRCEFSAGINIVTSPKENGNFVGKSSLLRSIYHTLGADGNFSPIWESSDNYLLYILKFCYNNELFTITRFHNFFQLYNSKDEKIFSVINRDDLSVELNKLFNAEIFLTNHNGELAVTPPAFNYIINYVDQKHLTPFEFKNFKNLTQFKDFYSSFLYTVVGLNSEEYTNLIKEKVELTNVQKELKENIKMHSKIISECNKKIGSPSDSDLKSLKCELESYNSNYNILLDKTSKIKEKIYNTTNIINEIENNINKIKDNINLFEKNAKKVLNKKICPTCNSELEGALVYFKQVNVILDSNHQVLFLQAELEKQKRNLEKDFLKYEGFLQTLKKYEDEIFKMTNSSKANIEHIGINKLKNEINTELQEFKIEISKAEQKLKAINQKCNTFRKLKKDINSHYIEKFKSICLEREIIGIKLNSIKKLDSRVSVEGNSNPLILLVWLCSIHSTKSEFNGAQTRFPIIIDNPNNADFADFNESTIFDLTYSLIDFTGQLITSKVGYLPEKNSNINEIKIDNDKESLLNKKDYDDNVLTIDKYSMS